MRFIKGLVFGKWTLKEQIGAGGHGQVWLAESEGGEQVAIKILWKIKKTAYQRFCNEVAVLKANREVPGILPILGEWLPEVLDDKAPPWFAMPVAERLRTKTTPLGLVRRAALFLPLAETLQRLHRKGIAHRDLKPSNLLWREGRACLCDFGLVDFPGKEDLTGKDESLGPHWAMAPEVRRRGGQADPIPADVYSFAKSLWMLLADNEQGFEGQYAADGSLGLQHYAEGSDDELDRHAFWGGLDSLLTDATEHDPARRPTMQMFRARLRRWLAIAGSWERSSAHSWIALQRKLFSVGTPRIAVWNDPAQIARVLTAIGSTSSVNHMYFPDGGGMDLESAAVSSREPGCIELHSSGDISIVRPRVLTFNSFDQDEEWNYFRLETANLQPSGVYADLGGAVVEAVTEIPEVGYVSADAWENDWHNGAPLPSEARPLLRYLRGPFVFFQKSSTYNLRFRVSGLDCYAALHAQMSASEFRGLIGAAAKQRVKTAGK